MEPGGETIGGATAPGNKLVYLETFGCQMNDNDSERMLGFLKDIKYIRTDKPSDADLIIINTCSIRDKAEQKVYSALGRFRELKMERPGLILAVGGCVAQQQGAALLKRAPYLDMVFGPHNIHRLKHLIRGVSSEKKRVVATKFNERIDPDEYGYTPLDTGGIKAFVSIMRGCDNFCSYCIVPYTRGREVSRKSSEIIEEIERLTGAGVVEVTLLGQNVNSYGGDGSFAGLLRSAAAVPELKRLRFITSHPKDISDELINLFGEEKKLCRHIHLPVQSGSDRILKAMRRGYTRDEYLSKAFRLKKLYPDTAITTDIIVGFPGEEEEDFEETMGLLRTMRFDNIFSFMYSPRPNTAAAKYLGQVPVDVKSQRLQALQEMQREITLERSRELIGATVEILVEGGSKADPGELTGRTGCNRIVNFPASPGLMPGSFTGVTITGASPNSLRAVPAQG